jgi:hypothetical protein
MKLEIEVHPVDSEHFFCDCDMTIYKVKVESIRIYVDDYQTKVEHLLKIVNVEDSNGFEVFGARHLTWHTVGYDDLFQTIDGAKAKRTAYRKGIRGE